jgi:hypothetical protein
MKKEMEDEADVDVDVVELGVDECCGSRTRYLLLGSANNICGSISQMKCASGIRWRFICKVKFRSVDQLFAVLGKCLRGGNR